MGRAVQRNALDTWADSTRPTRVAERDESLFARRVSGSNTRVAHIYFNFAPPVGARIRSAKLRLYLWERSQSTSVELRAIDTRTIFSKVSWARRPSVHVGPGMASSASTSGATGGGHMLEVDVKDQLQAVSDGLIPWRGWQISSLLNGPDVRIYGVNATGWGASYRPVLEVEWSEDPNPPEDLVPGDGRAVSVAAPRLRFDFEDVSGDTTMQGLQVRTSRTNNFTAPDWDSGDLDAVKPELDLATTSFPRPSHGGTVYWRVRVRDGDGNWSGWSQSGSWTYETKGELVVLAPAAGVFTDVTPPILAHITGRTMASYQVFVAYNVNPARRLWDTGRVSGSEIAVEPPKGVIRRDDMNYRFTIRAWDTVDRVTTPGATAAYEVEIVAHLDLDAGIPPVEDLTVSPLDPTPFVELTWAMTQTPDKWQITRNGVIVDNPELEETIQLDGTHVWTDRTAPGGEYLRYTVRPVINGKAGYGNPVGEVTPRRGGVWIFTDEHAVCLMNIGDENPLSLDEVATVHELPNGRTVKITQALRGWAGEIAGELRVESHGFGIRAAREQKEAFLAIRRDPAGARLAMGDLNIPVQLSGMSVAEQTRPGQGYKASVTVRQSGELEETGAA